MSRKWILLSPCLSVRCFVKVFFSLLLYFSALFVFRNFLGTNGEVCMLLHLLSPLLHCHAHLILPLSTRLLPLTSQSSPWGSFGRMSFSFTSDQRNCQTYGDRQGRKRTRKVREAKVGEIHGKWSGALCKKKDGIFSEVNIGSFVINGLSPSQ